MIARWLRRIADWIDPPRGEYQPEHTTVQIQMTDPVVDWITSHHTRPEDGASCQRPDEDYTWEHQPRWARGAGGFYL